MKTLLSFLLVVTLLRAEIYETAEFSEIEKHVAPGALVVFDIDNTLMEPIQTLGSDQWFNYRYQRFIDNGHSKTDALELTLKEYHSVQNVTKVRAVQPETPNVVSNLQSTGINIMALTARGLALAHRTVEQLDTIGIDLARNAPVQEEVFFNNGKGVIFRSGVLFCSGTHKGKALFKFLDMIGYKPSSITCIDDKQSMLKEVELLCKERNIPFTGLRYGYLDEKVRLFSPEIAEVQLNHFGRILTDEEAASVR